MYESWEVVYIAGESTSIYYGRLDDCLKYIRDRRYQIIDSCEDVKTLYVI